MSRKYKENAPENKGDPNAWMVTFADLTMLLLTFFVMLLTMKSMEAGKVRKLFLHSEGPLDYISQKEHVKNTPEVEKYLKSISITSKDVLDKAIELLEGIAPLPKNDPPAIHLHQIFSDIAENERGVTITLAADELFASGQAEIREDRLYLLDSIGRLFRHATNDILIMGHTDNIPIKGDHFASNLELSVYRALNVLHYLTNRQGLKPERLAAGGYGDMLPRYSNDSPENRSKNRRVEFVLRKPL
jgi:chemotaxis protein MotB